MESLAPLLGSIFSCVCCLVATVAIVGGVFFMTRKGKDAAEPAKLADEPGLGDPIATPSNANKDKEAAAVGPDESVDEEDAATVVGSQPAVEAAAEAPKRPPRTTSATIIAFDDDFEDDDE